MVHDVADDAHDQTQQGEEIQGREHHRIIAGQGRVEAQQAEPVERENDFGQQRTGEQNADERAGEPGDHDQHGIAEHMPVQNLSFGQALGPGGDHVLLVDLLQERVLGQHGQARESADHHRRNGQGHVPEIILHLGPGRQIAEILGDQPAQGEDVPIPPAREQHDQQNREQEPGHGVAEDHQARGPDIEPRAVAHRLGDAEGDRDQIDQQGGP